MTCEPTFNSLNKSEIYRRAATEHDLTFLIELRNQTMTAHFSASGIATSEEEHLKRVLFKFECAEIIICDNEQIGMLKVARDGLNWELIQIQLRSQFQSQGLGTRLVEEIITESKHAGASLSLSVLISNQARHLYERLGFSVVSQNSRSLIMILDT